MIQQMFLLRKIIWHVYVCMGGVIQIAVLLQSRHHHENVYVVLADGKRSTTYISMYDGLKLAPIKRSLPSMPKVTSKLMFLPPVDYNQITPNRANKEEKTGKVQHLKLNTKRRDNKTKKNSVPLARACNTTIREKTNRIL